MTTSADMNDLSIRVRDAIRTVHDFPKPGIGFKDITTVLSRPAMWAEVTDWFAGLYPAEQVDAVVGVDARGFLFAGAAAIPLDAGVVIARKKGKLPYETREVSYDLEYGKATLQMHVDAITPGMRVLVVDDLLATGGTVKAAIELIRLLGGEVLGAAFMVELGFLGARDGLDVPVHSLVNYES